MGKTPKKAAPGGDERNLYNRRLKATTAPSNPSETSLHKRQRESEISNRSKLSTLKKLPRIPRKNIGSQLGGPAKFRSSKPIGKPSSTSSIEKKIPPASKGEQSTFATMQPESEETELKEDATAQKENSAKDTIKESTKSEKEHVDRAASEPISLPKAQEDSTEKEIVIEKEQPDCSENANEVEKEKEVEEVEETDLNLRYETDVPVAKPQEETIDESKEEETEKCPPVVAPLKNGVHEKEDLQSESQTDTESNSVDVHELTTSEVSEVSESTSQTDVQKEPEKSEESNISKDISFVSYDPSIMLKDVQIKLNDCLKENSKLLDSRSIAHSTPSQPPKDVSYGKTLRNISGRRSLSRMRHVTVREHNRYSPNDSMFVNTSTASFPPDDTADFKILRYSTGLSNTLSTNGSPTERKRKTENEDWNSTKKQKTESENSLLNSSISLLKGLRRPIQVSTPVSELKFQTGKLEMDEESKAANEGSKKWCVIM